MRLPQASILLLLQTALVSVQGAMRLEGTVAVTSFINMIKVTLNDEGTDRISNEDVTTAFDSWSSTIEGSDGYKVRTWWQSSNSHLHFEWSRPGMEDTLECPASCRRDCVGDGGKMDPKRCITSCTYSCLFYT
ncbi:MAG: hypothetical protein J3Q66DRAFT_341687 [Benniella sp.]|nr:MAG: hypothetical protein J3Q66DRAFT_341687 [Benniella sp.]